ncbi:hypothetical protein [Glaesserella parasuis]|uniref:hypothetical protein n=1 Tax=Glaesserella parasuis TaxID=738 RepID=UPI003B67749B
MFGYKTKKQLLAEGYTHYGSLWGVPCYIGDVESESPVIATANFIPQWFLHVANCIVFTMHDLVNMNNTDAEPLMFTIVLKKPIEE